MYPGADALQGGGCLELWPWFPTPLLGGRKESSLIGSLAVSFTLNIKVKQNVRPPCVGRRGEGRAFSSRAGPGSPRAGTAFPPPLRDAGSV